MPFHARADLTRARIEPMVAAGMHVMAIRTALGCSEKAIATRLRAWGLAPRKGCRRMGPAELDLVRSLADGWRTCTEIQAALLALCGHRYRCEIVRRAILRVGGKVAPDGRRPFRGVRMHKPIGAAGCDPGVQCFDWDDGVPLAAVRRDEAARGQEAA